MNQQRLTGIADTHPLTLCILNDTRRHFDVRRLVNVHMAVAVEMFDHWHGCFTGHAANQTLATTGDRHVDQLTER